jgi:hypothetical protein
MPNHGFSMAIGDKNTLSAEAVADKKCQQLLTFHKISFTIPPLIKIDFTYHFYLGESI